MLPHDVVELLHVNHPHTRVMRELPHVWVIDGASYPYLDGPLRVQQALIHSHLEGRAMVKFTPEVIIPCIAVCIQMDHADRPILCQSAEDGQSDRVVPSYCN